MSFIFIYLFISFFPHMLGTWFATCDTVNV